MKRSVTIVDVASRAGVSVGTVSNVLNGRGSVRDAKRKAVDKAIRDLGFTPSMIATGMRKQRSNVIGLCVPFTNFQNFSLIADAVERISAAAGYELMQVYSRQDPAIELERIERLLAFRVGGLILIPSAEPGPTLDRLAKSRTPAVILNRPVDDKRFDEVITDHRQAMNIVVGELIARGHRKIVLASQYPSLSVTRWRVAAMRETVRTSGQQVEVVVLHTGASEATFARRLAPHFGGKGASIALICSNSAVTTWALRTARAGGLHCPADYSLFALDDPEWADIVVPSLSVVHQPTELLAQTAMKRLIMRMDGTATRPARTLIAPSVVFQGVRFLSRPCVVVGPRPVSEPPSA